MEDNHLNKPVYISKRKKKKNTELCKKKHKHNEQQKDKHEDIKKDIKIIKCSEGKYENLDFFF